jgi:hypothetical protein
MISLTVPEITRLLAPQPATPGVPGHADHWANWRRRHQARARWYHQRHASPGVPKLPLVSY